MGNAYKQSLNKFQNILTHFYIIFVVMNYWNNIFFYQYFFILYKILASSTIVTESRALSHLRPFFRVYHHAKFQPKQTIF